MVARVLLISRSNTKMNFLNSSFGYNSPEIVCAIFANADSQHRIFPYALMKAVPNREALSCHARIGPRNKQILFRRSFMSFSSLVPRCGIILFACRKSIMAVFILTAFASLANAQVILPAPQETISVSGGGALSYSVRSTKFPCGNSFPVGGIPPGNYILQNVYQNFVYTDVYGAQNTESATL
ncbi:MAG TPA: hypothetical protein VHA06_21665, partial [Candidatus Angelobacter sp.]|nr:hypothetical protein [Candidatus Angelobacter sp.]